MKVFMDDLLFSREHVWVRVEGHLATIGITDYAQHELGDIVFVELKKTVDKIETDCIFGTIESVKAVSELYSPVAGEITAVNQAVIDKPDAINKDPYKTGWLIKMKASKIDGLLSHTDYKKFIDEESA